MTTAVITGASQGIGAAIALALAGEPQARLFLLARTKSSLEAVASQCQSLGAHAEAMVCDVTDEAAVAAVAGELEKRGETLDLLINNAGHFLQKDLFSTSPKEFRQCIESNLVSAFLVSNAFVPAMMKQGHGTIFFMGSVASLQAYPGSGAYCAAKHGLLGLARAIRQTTQASGLRVTTIMPGATDSPSWDNSEIPKQRLMPAEDIAQSVLAIYKLSDRSVVEEIVLRPTAGDL